MTRIFATFAAAACFIATGLVTAGAAQANTSPPPPAPEQLVSVGTATVETYTPGFKTLLSTTSYGPETEGELMPAVDDAKPGSKSPGGVIAYNSGKGGSSSSSGCRKVTITNRASTVLGFTAYRFKTWTNWCWTRSSQVVRSVSTGWSITDVDSQQYWKGLVQTVNGFYDYSTNDGHPKSAYKHYRQGRFENCVLKYGCIGTTYPANTLRSYYNGTWVWSTSGT